MLVLTRRLDESVIIGENIVVKILSIDGDKVKIGIDAPRDVPILRDELHQAVLEQEKIAALLAAGQEPDTFAKLRDLLAAADNPPDPDQANEHKPTDTGQSKGNRE